MIRNRSMVRGDAGDAPLSALQSQSPPKIHHQSTKHNQIPDLCASSNKFPPVSTSIRRQQAKIWQVNQGANSRRGDSHEFWIYKKLEGFRKEERSRSKSSRSAELLGHGATTSAPLHSKKSTKMGQVVVPAKACGWQAPSSWGTANQAKDSEKLPTTQVGSLHPLSKSYAQVVQGTRHEARRHTDASLGVHPLARRSSSTTGHRRRVMFIDSPNIAVFLKGSVPADILLLSRPILVSKTHTTELKLKSCLKSPLVSTQKALTCSISSNLSGVPSPAVTTRSQQGNQLPVARVFQEQYDEIPWQTVREKYWWRKGKLKSRHSVPITQQQPPTIFKLKTRGRCFNCLAKGHLVASCRDPPTCWRCRGSGHLSYQCSRRASERRHRSSMHPLLKQRSHIQQQAEDGIVSVSDAIPIIPQDHSMTTQQLEAWFGTIDRSRKTTSLPQLENNGADGTTISSPVALSSKIVSPQLEAMNLDSVNVHTEIRAWRQLWKNRHVDNSPSNTNTDVARGSTKIGEQFFREAVPYSDAIHIIPLASFTEKLQKISLESRLDNKNIEHTIRHVNMQQSDNAVVSPVTAPQQSRMLDELYTSKLTYRKLSPSESKMDQPMAKTPNAEEMFTEDTASVQKKSTEPKLVTKIDFADMNKEIKEVVTKPLGPCMLQIPSSKSFGKKEKKEEQRRSPRHKIKLRKQTMRAKMAQIILAMARGKSAAKWIEILMLLQHFT